MDSSLVISVDRRAIVQRSGLPLSPEILELVFWHMDESTYFIALRTCRQFAEAGSTRKNLIRQVRRLPGLRPGLEDLCTEDLRRECCRRAAVSGCLAWILADIRRCSLPSGTVTSKSIFSTNTSANRFGSRLHGFLLALANENGTITIYNLSTYDVWQNLTLGLVNHHGQVGSSKIIAMAFSAKGDLIVLHDQRGNAYARNVTRIDNFDSELPEAEGTCEVSELTTFYRCNDKARDSVTCLGDCRRSQAPFETGARPVGIALACNGNAVMACTVKSQQGYDTYNLTLVETKHKSSKVGKSKKDGDLVSIYSPNKVKIFPSFPDKTMSCKSIRIRYAEDESTVLAHDEAMPLPNYSLSFTNDTGPVSTGFFSIDPISTRNGNVSALEQFYMGTAFYGAHSESKPIDDQTDAVCRTSYLVLGLVEVMNEPLEVSQKHLYLFRHHATSNASVCSHRVNLDRSYLTGHGIPVALLAGWRAGVGTVGSLLEITPRGKRVASTAWDRILMWTFDPEQLEPDNLQLYFPPRDYSSRAGYGRIRPILLPPQGVVHAMKWINEDVLFALTDMGLVSWNVGPRASGRRYIDGAVKG